MHVFNYRVQCVLSIYNIQSLNLVEKNSLYSTSTIAFVNFSSTFGFHAVRQTMNALRLLLPRTTRLQTAEDELTARELYAAHPEQKRR